MMKYLLLTPLILIGLFGAVPSTVHAASEEVDVFKDICRKEPNSAACKDRKLGTDSSGKTNNPLFGPDGVFTKVINIISIVVGLAAVIMVIAGGLKFITSGNNPQEVSNAREQVIYAIIGLIVAASAQLIVKVFLAKIS